jgi:predicted nucleotidyltransferase
MINNRDINIRLIIHVAKCLGDLRKKVVFVGGCATGLFITDPAMPEVRATQDVDVIVEVASRVQYYNLEEELRAKGFKQDMSEGAPLCRWLVDGIKVDVMPTQEDILGFSNYWYLPAIKNAESIDLEKGLTIQLASPPYFLATKLEAFKGRGGGDYMASHDMEDIITVLDGRPEIISEIRSSSEELQTFLAGTLRGLLAQEGFHDALPGHLPPDRASQARLPRLIKRLEEISETRNNI